MKLLNDTALHPDEVMRLRFLGFTIDYALERTTDFFQHPHRAERVISMRVTHNDRLVIIQDEPKWWYLQPLSRWLSGKPHIISTRAKARKKALCDVLR